MPIPTSVKKSLWVGVGASLAYMGLTWIFFTALHKSPAFGAWAGEIGIMSFSFLLIVPFATGALINWSAPRSERYRPINVFVFPILYSLAAFGFAFLLEFEGKVCLLMAIPIFVVLSVLGAMAFCLISNRIPQGDERRAMAGFLLLPILGAPIEGRLPPTAMHTTTLSQIEIAAPRGTVWKNIIRVPRIAKSEIPISLSVLMGFPDPVEATLSREGVGGVRRASFQGNVLFTETIDVWEEGKRISFSIVPNTAEIPPTTMDEHMIVGGDYFQVLRGTYELEDLGGGRCLLKLSSHHVATTDINLYADLWGRLLMWDIQNRILKVVRNRCERGFIPPRIAPS